MKFGLPTRRLAIALVALLLLGGGGMLRAQVLVIYGANSMSYSTDVRTKIAAAAPELGPVTIYNAGVNGTASLPTLNDLLSFKAVLVFTDNGGFASASAVGNLLADYVDAGGGVVDAVFSHGTVAVGGRWQSDGYSALVGTSQTSGSALTLGTIAVPDSPILAGVNSFSGGASFRTIATVRDGATLIASWSNGDPLVAVAGGRTGHVVSLNFFPPSSDARSDLWTASTDGAKLLANSLNFVAVPEPSTYALLALGLGAVLWLRRRR